MKVRSRKLCALLLCAVFSVSQTAVAGAAEIPAEISADEQEQEEAVDENDIDTAAEDETTVTIFSTNDIHGNVAESDGHIGLAQVAGIAESTENSLLIDAGDATQGDSFASVDAGQSVIQVMNSAGYEAMALGNHEFDYGPDELAANVAAASFPVLSANVEGLDGVDHHEIITVADKKIAVVGLTTTATKPSKFKGLVVGDETEAAKREIAEVKDEADAIILVTHMGDNDAAVNCTSKKLLDSLTPEELAEVTAVVDGHSHTLEMESYKDIPIVQAGMQLANLGQITLHFTGEDVAAEGKVLGYDDAMSYPVTSAGEEAKARVSSFIAEMKEQQKSILEETVGYNENVPLWGGYIYYDYAEPRIVETNLGDFICDAFNDAAGEWLESQGK